MSQLKNRVQRLERDIPAPGQQPDRIIITAPGDGSPAFEMVKQPDGSWQHNDLPMVSV